MLFLKYTLKNLFLFLTQKNYRIFYYLMFRYGGTGRFIQRNIKFNGIEITVVDALSFLWQYKEIFTEEFYKFKSDKGQPVVYDCGANIGMSCLYYHTLYKNAKIKAFEADPAIASVLKHNMALNHITNVEVIAKAVWTDNKGFELFQDGADGASLVGEGKGIFIETIRLRDALAEETNIDFLKMDIEGAEIEVINDIKDQLHKVENIFIEYHSYNGREQHLGELLSTLTGAGLRYYCLPVYIRKSPLVNRHLDKKMDHQINVFGYRC